MSQDDEPDRASKQRRPGEIVGVEGAFIEGVLGLVSGFAFGFVGTTMGHPADTIKTKMQADPRFSGHNALFVFRTTVKRDGFFSLYRGFLPPLLGGSCFMSAVFGTYSSTFAACEGTAAMEPVGDTGVRPAIVLASTAAAVSRSMIETPFELLKTRMQLGREWRVASGTNSAGDVGITSKHTRTTSTLRSVSRHVSLSQLRECYKGFKVTLYRNVLLHGTMFTVLDYSTRAAPDLAGAPVVGAFFKGAVCNTLGWLVAWPMELLKSKIQGDTTGQLQRRSILSLVSEVVRTDGVGGLWRGFALGATRSVVVNGISMVAYEFVLDLRRKRGEHNQELLIAHEET